MKRIQKTTQPPERLPIMEWFAYIYAQSRKREGVEAVLNNYYHSKHIQQCN
jgi:hypothetical protein